ncbi:hypothetical protein ACIP66_03200 [Pseudomonas sp. NPDC088429]|uniref:hypothetical protein n=1 Tax=Pseudomonas sp. NPDC088429 TaxID=3364455 RepID=UPI003820FEBB
MLYNFADAVALHQPNYAHVAVDFFNSRLYGLGGKLDIGDALLAAEDWKERMCCAWAVIDKKSRTEALKLDYRKFQNYWPTLDFCTPSWDFQVEEWMSSTD